MDLDIDKEAIFPSLGP